MGSPPCLFYLCSYEFSSCKICDEAIWKEFIVVVGKNKYEKAIINKHMMFREALETAKSAYVKRLWLTHFSPSLSDPKEYTELAANIFENTLIPNDLEMIELRFE